MYFILFYNDGFNSTQAPESKVLKEENNETYETEFKYKMETIAPTAFYVQCILSEDPTKFEHKRFWRLLQ